MSVGWKAATLGEIASTALGKMLDKGKDRGLKRVRYLRNVNVQWGRIDTDDVLTMEIGADDSDRFIVLPGDLLVCEGGEIGRAAIWHGPHPIAYQKALHRVRPNADLDAVFLRYLLEHYHNDGTLARYSTGSTIAHLPQQNLRRLPVRYPDMAEQRRIVEILEEHLSHLDAAERSFDSTFKRSVSFERLMVIAALAGDDEPGPRSVGLLATGTDDRDLPSIPASWAWRRLGEVADVVGGVTKDAKKQSDPAVPEVPYLRVANVQRGRLDLRVVTKIRVPATKAAELELRRGDVLLNEGGDRDKLGRGWVWEGQIPGCIHQNHVFRARVRDDVIDPYLLSWIGNYIGGTWCERNGKQSVNLASISLSKIKLMPVPVPPRNAQLSIRSRIEDNLVGVQGLRTAVEANRERSARLRRSLLAAAFSGRLTGRASDLERAEEAIA